MEDYELLESQAKFQRCVLTALMDLRDKYTRLASQLGIIKDEILTHVEPDKSKKMKNLKGSLIDRSVVVEHLMANVVSLKLKTVPWWMLLDDQVLTTVKEQYDAP